MKNPFKKSAFAPTFALALTFTLSALAFQATAAITGSSGWLETFYVKWDKSNCAVKYTVEYRRSGAGQWAAVDDALIREYGDHFRADVLGIAAGTYEARVTPQGGTAMTATGIQVLAHDRSGFAFLNNVVPGAYKADGTLKDNAVVIYITDQNKDAVSFAVKTNASGATTASVGLEAIVRNLEKGYEDRPLAFRFVGTVTDRNFTLGYGGGDINIKDNAKNKENHLTFEGVGNDAVAYGWGFKTARAKNLEIRNLAFMLTNSDEGDNVGLNTSSAHVWIHNNDMFYGNAGGDADQAKGDGATDAKASTNITISYNRYWDSGKTHLFGNSVNETPGNITVHHNWYNRSDSRHPRVRKHYVHVYNNYYDGVATYGIGAVMASSIFAEKNYFRNTNRPMMISKQGTDEGTFSGEDGGMIKAFSNFMDNSSKSKYKPWSGSNTVEFDAYEVSSADATVPSTVKAKKGGATFNNSMIPANYPAYTTEDDSAAVRTQVTTYAGRYWGGDFGFTFTSSHDGSTAIIAALKTALQNYSGGLVSVQSAAGGTFSCAVVTPPTDPCEANPTLGCPNYCTVNPTVPECVVTPPDQCETNPAPGCANYCDANPTAPECVTTDPCDTDPTPDCPNYCTLNPTVAECVDTPPPARAKVSGSGEFIENLMLADTVNAAYWKIETGLDAELRAFGDRAHQTASIPAQLLGAEWVSTAMGTRTLKSPGALLEFNMKKAGHVFVLHENRVAEKPAWLAAGFAPTAMTATVRDSSADPTVDREFTVYVKRFEAGETVAMGLNSNNGATSCMMYLIAVTEDYNASARGGAARAASYSLRVSRAGKGGEFRINYAIREKSAVRLDLFDVRGNRVKTLVKSTKGAGTYQERLPAKGLATGMYLIKLKAGRQTLQERIVITK